MDKPKILIWDIETSHLLVYTFGLFKQNIPIEHIEVDRHLFCASYRWYGEKKTHTISILDDPKRFKKDHHDDYYVVKELRKVLMKAHAHVAHYGDGFDMPILNERLIYHNLKPIPKLISLDTCKLAKRHFNLVSYKLDYIARHWGHKGKLDNPRGLWVKCFNGDEKALKQMGRYNRGDIDALFFVLKKMVPFVNHMPMNAGLFYERLLDEHGLERPRCVNPLCGSLNVIKKNWQYTRIGKYQRYSCKDCGKWFNERTAQSKGIPVK